MKPHTFFKKTLLNEELLCLVDHVQFFLCDLFAINKSRRKAGICRLTPCRKSHSPGDQPNLRLCKPRLPKRALYGEFSRSAKARPIVSDIIHVGAFRHMLDTVLFCNYPDLSEYPALTKVTSVAAIMPVTFFL